MKNLLSSLIVALAAGAASALTVIDDVKAGATPIDTLGTLRARIQAVQAKDAKEKIVLDLDFGEKLNAEAKKFANERTVFWKGTDSLAAVKARAEALGDRPNSVVGRDLLIYPWWRDLLVEHQKNALAAKGAFDLVLIGDSITDWWDNNGGAGTVGCWDKLTGEFKVQNLGICGDRTENVIWRLENGELDGYRTKTVMIMIGTNNGGDSEEEVAAGVKRILEIVREKQPQAKVLLCAIFPRFVEPTHPGRLRITRINKLLEKLCDGERVTWTDFGWKFLAPDGTLPKAMMHDTLHPTAAGYKVWYDSVIPWIRENVKNFKSQISNCKSCCAGKAEEGQSEICDRKSGKGQSEICDRKSGKGQSEICDRKSGKGQSEICNLKSETSKPQTAAAKPQSETGSQQSEICNLKSEICNSTIGRILAEPAPKIPCYIPSGRYDYGAYQGFGWWVDGIVANRRQFTTNQTTSARSSANQTTSQSSASQSSAAQPAAAAEPTYDLVLFGATLVKNWTRGSLKFGGKAALDELFGENKGLVLAMDEDRMESTLWRAENGELDGFKAKWIVLSAGERNVYDTPEDLAKAFKALVEIVRAKHPESKIILMGMMPQGHWRAPAMDEANVQQRAVNLLIRNLADGKKVFFLDLSPRLRTGTGDTNLEMMPKDIHPSPKMFDYWKREIVRVMNGVQLDISRDQRWRNLPADDVPQLIYVSPSGNDGAAGTKEAPLRTLAGARDRIRKIRADYEGKVPGGAIVTFLAGEYPFDGTVEFTEEDSGTPSYPIVYRAERPLAASFSGAQRPDWKLNEKTGNYETVLPGTGLLPGFSDSGCGGGGQPWLIEHPIQLFQDGERLTCARWPNKGASAYVKECYADAKDNGGDTTWAERFDKGMISIMDIDGNVKDLSALAKETDAYAWGLWFVEYDDAALPVIEVDAKRNRFRFDPRLAGHGWRRKAECRLMNMLSELDQPGEWAIDRKARKVYVKPLAGKKEMPVVAIVPTLVAAKGLHDVQFDGFAFEYVRDTVLTLKDCRDVVIRTSVIRHTSNNAIAIAGGANCRVVGCDLYDLGKGGVSMSGGSFYTLGECGHTVDNCHIHDYGQVIYNYQPAIAMSGTGCRATHNLIHHTRHQAIQFVGSLHYIGFNVMHDLCMHNGDAGAIYSYNTTGAWSKRGTVIEYNAIHMVGDQPRAYMCDCIYLDAFVSGTIVRGNLVNRATLGIFSSGGQDNQIYHNVVMRTHQSIRKWNLGNRHHPCSQLGADSYIYYPVTKYREIFEMGFWKDRFPQMLAPLDRPDPVEAQCSHYVNIYSNALIATSRVIFSDVGPYWNDSETGATCRDFDNVRYEEDPGFVDYRGGNWEVKVGSPLWKQLGGGTRFAEMGLYDSPLRVSPAVKWGADMTPIRKLKREFSAGRVWIELFWKGDLPEGVTECTTDRDGCEGHPWGTKGKTLLAAFPRQPHDHWQTYRFAFTPTADGEFKLELAGDWGEKTRYDDVVATGCELVNGDFSTDAGWTVPPPPKDQGTYDRDPVDEAEVDTYADASKPWGIVNGEGVANQFRRLVQMIRVKKGQRVTITFKARGFDDPAQDY